MTLVKNLFNHLLSLKIENTPPEIKLLLMGCSPNSTELLTNHKDEFLSTNLDWNFLFNFATYHQIKYLFYHNCKLANFNIIPASFLPTLQRETRSNLIRNLKLTQELNQLIQVFQKAKIPIIPYKGILLSGSLYPDLSVRYCFDIDLLVSSENFTLVKEILLSLGYQSKSQYQWEESFTNPQTQIEVDIHQNLTPSFFDYNLNFSDIWHNRQSTMIAGVELETLDPQDLLIIFCLQFTKDTWERQGKLIKIFDLAYFLKDYSDLDLQEESKRMSSLGLNNSFIFCLLMTQEICFLNLPLLINLPYIIPFYSLMIYQHLIQYPLIQYHRKNLAERIIDKIMFENCHPVVTHKLTKEKRLEGSIHEK